MIQAKPSPLTRFRAAVKFYRDGWRHFQVQPRQPSTKKIPFIWPQWFNGQPQWQLINYQAYAEEGFSANSVIYAAIMYKTRATTLAPLRAYTGTPEKPELLPPGHWLQGLCMRPNRFQSWSEFITQAWVYWLLSGNNFTVFSRAGGRIEEMYNLRPDRCFIIPRADRKAVIGFWYVPEGKSWTDGVPYLPQDVMHNKLPNPLDPLDGLGYGLSPLSPAAHSGDIDNDLTKFLRLFFKSGAMPSGLLSFDVPMLDEDVAAARRRWNEVYGGYENWAEESVAVLDQGGKYQRIGLSFQEMDVSAIDARNESRIVAPFGVPLNLIESRPQLVQSTYSNKETDRVMFWEDTMEPELKWWESDWQYYLQGERGEFVMYDLSATPAYQKRQLQRIDRFQKAFETGAISADKLQVELGLDPEPVEPMQPEQDDTQAGQPEAEEETEEAEAEPVKKKELKAVSRARFQSAADELARAYEPEFNEAGQASLEADRRYIEAIINDANRDARQQRASLNWEAVAEAIAVYLLATSPATWQRNFTGPLGALMTERVTLLNEQLGQSYPAADLLRGEWFNEYTIKFAQPINATTEEAIRRLIEQGVIEGWSVPALQKRLGLMFQQWMTGTLTAAEFEWLSQRMPDYRLEAIVRTETIRGLNVVSNRLYQAWGNTRGREWVSAHDNRVRFDHAEADGQIALWGQNFNVGGYSMEYPGDSSAPPSLTVNCRCTVVPVF